MQHYEQIKSAYSSSTGRYDYDTFDHIGELMADADLTIANLELTLGGVPFTGYPKFSAPDEIAVALKESGVDILVTANNHSCDRRKRASKEQSQYLIALRLSTLEHSPM